VGVLQIDDVRCLGDVEADEESLPIRLQGRLQLPVALDSESI
jgi:hypothetical protein